MMKNSEPIAYKMVPIYPTEEGKSAICAATGEVLETSSTDDQVISRAVFDKLASRECLLVRRSHYSELRDQSIRLKVVLGIVSAGLDSLVTSCATWQYHPGGFVKIVSPRGGFRSSFDFASLINQKVNKGDYPGIKWHQRRELLIKGLLQFMSENHPDESLTLQLAQCPELDDEDEHQDTRKAV